MTRHASALGWGALAILAVAAALAPAPVQLGFAALAIGVVGMAHGGADLAVVRPDRRAPFLLAYALVAGACIGWWITAPVVAMPVFLLASAVHFAVEDAGGRPAIEKAAYGVALVAAPATLHGGTVAALLAAAGGDAAVASVAARMLAIAGGASVALLLPIAVARRDGRLAAGVAALTALPPLVGFSVGFLVLHAMPQTRARAAAMGCHGLAAYLRAVAPVLLAAIALAGAVGAAILRIEPSGMRALFADIAALAMPHLAVTPWFEGRLGGERARALPVPA